jgi:hypothetical protein
MQVTEKCLDYFVFAKVTQSEVEDGMVNNE